MSRPIFALIWVLITLLILGAMWWGWRGRSRRDAEVSGSGISPTGEIIGAFQNTFYVSTNEIDNPLARVAVPALKYRGYADVTVRRDGVTIEVRGAKPFSLLTEHLHGGYSAAARPGKAVERDGLALIRWHDRERQLESSFRFQERAEHDKFLRVIDEISTPALAHDQHEHEEHAK